MNNDIICRIFDALLLDSINLDALQNYLVISKYVNKIIHNIIKDKLDYYANIEEQLYKSILSNILTNHYNKSGINLYPELLCSPITNYIYKLVDTNSCHISVSINYRHTYWINIINDKIVDHYFDNRNKISIEDGLTLHTLSFNNIMIQCHNINKFLDAFKCIS